ncbi:hypothetical protein Dimus_033514, partial [Dionaea muscipula]
DKGGVHEADQSIDPVVGGSPMIEELNREVNEILARLLLSKVLHQRRVEADPSDVPIPTGTDGGTSQLLKEVAEMEENEGSEEYEGMGGAGEVVRSDEEEEGTPEVDEDEGRKREGRGDVGPSSLERIDRSLLAPRRLRLPSTSTVRRS